VFFTIDATRSDLTWLLDLVDRVATEGHMDAFTLVDTFGVLSPQAATYFTKKVKERIKKPIEIHFHPDFGLGVANTINAVLAGGEVIHTTITGIGERAGNTPMEDLVLALKTMYGVDLGIKTEHFVDLSRAVCAYAKHSIPSNRPIVGERLYDIESGIIASWVRMTGNDKLLSVSPFRPELIGQHPVNIVMVKRSGIDSIATWLDDRALEATEEQRLAMVSKVQGKGR